MEVGAKHPWWARTFVGLAMLILAFVGLIITDLYQQKALNYWKIMVLVFTLLSLGLSVYLRRKKEIITFVKIAHEIFHWLGLIVSVYLISIFVDRGIMGRFQAALVIITLLSLTTYLLGIYLDKSFIIIGVALGVFAVMAAFIAEYIYAILPLVIFMAAFVLYLMYRKAKHLKKFDDTNTPQSS